MSGIELALAACREGIVGSFPTHNARSPGELAEWLERLRVAAVDAQGAFGPYAPNLVVHRGNKRLDADMEALLRDPPPFVVTSVGPPGQVIGALHDAGVGVLADVASLRHAERAVSAGADGLVLLCGGAGGNTGWANPFAFIRAVRERFEGIIAVAGGIAAGSTLLAAQVAGADLCHVGTLFVASQESMADPEYKRALVAASLDDVVVSSTVTGLPVNVLRDWMATQTDAKEASTPSGGLLERMLDNLDRGGVASWSSGHAVASVTEVLTVAQIVAKLDAEYGDAVQGMRKYVSQGSE
ncbi:NAD(P)H-dependent flavin oxidoreductase [Streptomyces sp. NPDC090088]|uniref:NAD(P)H-dependent flavin oxidoreductase n=1 Tax=Streptomyces sp. NPDC090088 TaxID=3365944 RepID=UPI003807D552